MGGLSARDVVEWAPDIRSALEWHLSCNHFPPVPLEWIDTCVQIIEHVQECVDEDTYPEWDDEVDNPVREGEVVNIGKVFEACT